MPDGKGNVERFFTTDSARRKILLSFIKIGVAEEGVLDVSIDSVPVRASSTAGAQPRRASTQKRGRQHIFQVSIFRLLKIQNFLQMVFDTGFLD